jgi:hypothetical protein
VREESRLEKIRRLVDDRIVQACEQLRMAIRARQRLACLYNEHVLVFCPQLLGHRADGPHVLAFVVAGDPAVTGERLRSPRRWRWLSVADMWGVSGTYGPWIAAPRHTRPALDGLTVDVELP